MARLRAAALALFLAGPALAAGEAPPSPHAGFPALLRMAQTGEADQARRQLAVLQRANGVAPAEARLIEAILARRGGDFAASETILRDLLDADPSRRLIRFELAQTLAAAGRYTTARFQVDRLIDSERDPRLERVYRVFLARILAERPWSLDAGFSIGPASNINGGSSEAVVDAGGKQFVINPASRARAGVAATGFARGAWRVLVQPDMTISLTGTGRFQKYSVSALDRYTGQAGLRGEFYLPRGARLDAEIAGGGEWTGGSVSARTVSGALSWRQPVGRTWQALLAARVIWHDAVNGKTLDGAYGSFTIGAEHAFNAGFRLGAAVDYNFDRRGVAAFEYDGTAARVFGYRELPHGVSIEAGVEAGERRFRGVFPLLPVVRRDLYASAYATFTKRDWALGGFAPQLTLTASHQKSNVAFYTNSGFGASVGFTRAF